MTTKNADSANDTCLSALLQHIDEVQTKAHCIAEAMEVINYMESEGACPSGRYAVSTMVQALANEVANSLDRINLPEA